jgi:hypothetical protein
MYYHFLSAQKRKFKKNCDSRWMGYIDEILLICKYSGTALTNAILLGFEAQSNELEKLPKKAQKVLLYLNDDNFWFGCNIVRIIGVKIFKHAMKFLESNDGLVANEIHFEVQNWLTTVEELKQNLGLFEDIIQDDEQKRSTLIEYLCCIESEITFRFGEWKQLPLLWAALASSQITKAKDLASDFFRKLHNNKSTFLQSIEWEPLQLFLNQTAVVHELKSFAFSKRKLLENFPLLQAFHEKYFQFPVHNVDCERAIAAIYRYKLEAPSANPLQISAVCRNRYNDTKLPSDISKFWKGSICINELYANLSNVEISQAMISIKGMNFFH